MCPLRKKITPSIRSIERFGVFRSRVGSCIAGVGLLQSGGESSYGNASGSGLKKTLQKRHLQTAESFHENDFDTACQHTRPPVIH